MSLGVILIYEKTYDEAILKMGFKTKNPWGELASALSEVQNGNFEANLGGNIYKKRVRFKGQGKSSSRTILCY